VGALGFALGLASEQSAYRFAHPAGWIPDLAVGWTFIACGLVAWERKPSSRTGVLMVATGCAWFLPNFSFATLTAARWIADRSLFVYRGPLVHLMVGFPTGRATSKLARIVVATGYLAALATPVWRSDPASIVLAAILAVVCFLEYRRSLGRSRRARLVAFRAAALVALVIAGGAVARIVLPIQQVVGPSHFVFELTLCALAIGLLVSLLTAPWEHAVVTDLVVEMGEARSDGLRDELARALGDPGLEVGFWVPDANTFVDALGRPLALPAPGSDRAVTAVRGGEQPLAVLVHDRAVLDDPGLLEAVSAAARLAARNARLQAEVRARIAELAASRRRVLEAGDEERRRLERRLHDGAERRLEDMAVTLERTRTTPNGSEAGERIDAAATQLRRTLDDLTRLGRGLHPRELTELGLEGALLALAARASIPVSVSVDMAGRLAPTAEAAAYFLCAEALTNIAKYAEATRAEVSVTEVHGRLTVEVTDDGVGGADGARGSGLRGLTDRFETLGGSLVLESPPGSGTRLTARIPLVTGPS
jgi:signal transduction histidine kinase